MALIPASNLEGELHLLVTLAGLSIDKDYFFTKLPNDCFQVYGADIYVMPLERQGSTYGAIITIGKGGRQRIKTAHVPPVEGTYSTDIPGAFLFMENAIHHRDMIFVPETLCPGDVNHDIVQAEWFRQREYG